MVGTQRHRKNDVYCEEHPDAYIVEDYSARDMNCSARGVVLADRDTDVGSEWQKFKDDGSSKADPSRVGSAENTLLRNNLTTMIGLSYSGHSGITKYSNRKYTNSSDRILLAVFKIIRNMGEKLNGSKKVINTANEIFKKVHDSKILKGRSYDALAAACLFIAFRKEKILRTVKEVFSVASISANRIKKCYSKIMTDVYKTPLENVNVTDYVAKFCRNLDLPAEILRAASRIATVAKSILKFYSRMPTSIAAAAIYMATKKTAHKKSRKIIAEASGASERTIQNTYKDMQIYHSQLLPNKF